jgi:hypothetical protein
MSLGWLPSEANGGRRRREQPTDAPPAPIVRTGRRGGKAQSPRLRSGLTTRMARSLGISQPS